MAVIPKKALSTALVIVAGLVAVLSAGRPVPQAGGGQAIGAAMRDRAQRAGHARVIVDLKLGAPYVTERRLPNASAVLDQRQRIAGRTEQLLSRLPAAGHRVVRRFQTVPYVVLDLTPAALDVLAASDDIVQRVMDDVILEPLLADSVPLIEGDVAWSAGFDGSGTTIAVLDTGVDSAHPFLAGKVVEEACYSSTVSGTSLSFCPNGLEEQTGAGSATPCSLGDCFHGTHVAGIAAGDDPMNPEQAPGVAKGAHIMAVQVFSQITDADSCGGAAPCVGAFTSDVIAGLERVYAVALSGQQNIVAVNMSLGSSVFTSPCDSDPQKPMIDALRGIGVATVVASGNSGYPIGLSSPACISSAVSVGSTDKSDAVSWYSNVSSFLSLFAPGEAITSSLPGGSYGELSGTSMAAPHVAGTWAVLKQAAPDASVDDVLSALRSTGLPITDTRFSFLGITNTIPRVRVFEALMALAPVPNPAPAVAALSPVRIRAGSPSFTLVVTGSGFDGLSAVQWNGAARPTRFVRSTMLEATISAGDVASTGSAQVRVATPSPGGGTSSSLTFTIDPPPVLAISAATVAPGGQVTVTLTNGVGGASDWLALAQSGAAATGYLQWTYVGAGVTSRTWTVAMPSTAGTYEFRLFLNNGYALAATSPLVTVDANLTPAPVLGSLSPASASAGGAGFTLGVTGSSFVSTSRVRWNGVDRSTTFVSATQLQAAIPAGDLRHGPDRPGHRVHAGAGRRDVGGAAVRRQDAARPERERDDDRARRTGDRDAHQRRGRRP